jgi:hypothetical protein
VLKAEKYTSLHKLLMHAHRQQLHSRFFIVMNP